MFVGCICVSVVCVGAWVCEWSVDVHHAPWFTRRCFVTVCSRISGLTVSLIENSFEPPISLQLLGSETIINIFLTSLIAPEEKNNTVLLSMNSIIHTSYNSHNPNIRVPFLTVASSWLIPIVLQTLISITKFGKFPIILDNRNNTTWTILLDNYESLHLYMLAHIFRA